MRHVHFPVQPDALQDSASAASVAQRHADWKADLPEDDDALWDRLGVARADLYPRVNLGGALGLLSRGFKAVASPLVTWAFLIGKAKWKDRSGLRFAASHDAFFPKPVPD